MDNEIVARIRLYANASIDGGWASVFRSDLNIAADAIERLRVEAERLRAERDEARAAIRRLRRGFDLVQHDGYGLAQFCEGATLLTQGQLETIQKAGVD